MKRFRFLACAMTVTLIMFAAGCATQTGTVAERTEQDRQSRMRKTLIAVGAALAVGALVAKQAEGNAKDAVRDAAQR